MLHFSAIADAVELPLILYNVPGRTGVDLLPGTDWPPGRAPTDRSVQGSYRGGRDEWRACGRFAERNLRCTVAMMQQPGLSYLPEATA